MAATVNYCANHPDKPVKCKGLCEQCYQLTLKHRPSKCHPEKNIFSRGLCYACYIKEAKRSTCHPDKPVVAFGLCEACYRKYRLRANPELAKAKIKSVSIWRKNHPELVRKIKQRHYKKYRVRLDAANKAWKNKQSQTWRRSAWLKRTYGLTIDTYTDMLMAQNGVCAICARNNIVDKALAVDHNHSTGEIRGLLCAKCNTAIALLDESIDSLDAARKYLTSGGTGKYMTAQQIKAYDRHHEVQKQTRTEKARRRYHYATAENAGSYK